MKTLLVCLLLLETLSSALFFGNISKPDLLPVNPFVFVGEELVLTCSFPGKSSALGYMQERDDNVTEDFLSRPDNHTLVYTATNTSRFLGKVGCDGIPFNCWHPEYNLSGGQILHLDYQPERPRDVDCVYLNGRVAVCTWTLAQNFICPQYLNVTAFIRSSGSIIVCQSANNTSCTSPEVSILLVADLVIEIRNKKRPDAFFNFTTTINFDERVKYDPVTEINVTPVNSRIVNLTWSHMRSPRNLIIRANITPRNGTSFSLPLTGNTTGSEWMRVAGLNPAVQYSVSVDVLPIGGGVWSDPQYAVFTMPPDAPDRGPPSTPGAYTHTPSCNTGTSRDVTVFWQELAEEYRNGALTEYMLRVQPGFGGQVGEVREVRVAATETKAVLPGLDCSQAYTVHISALNPQESTTSTLLEIPPSRTVVPVRQLLVRLTSHDVRAHWNSSISPDNFTVFWCRSVTPCFRVTGQCQCAGQVTWLTVSGSQSEAVIPGLSPDFSVAGTFRYGVSASVQSQSSSIVWEDCIYQANATPTSHPSQVVVNNATEAVKVTYAAESCVSSAAAGANVFVKEYRVHWCLASDFLNSACASGEDSMLVAAEQGGEARLTELQPWKLYMVQVEARTLDKLYGPPSPAQPAMLLPPTGFQEGQVAGVVSGVLVVIIAVGLVIFCVCRCRKMKKLEVNIPKSPQHQSSMYGNFNPALTYDDDIPINRQSKDFTNQVSVDSGVGTETLSMKDSEKSPLSSPKPDLGYVQADGNPTPSPFFPPSFTPPCDQQRNFTVFHVQGHVGPNTTQTGGAVKEVEAQDGISAGVTSKVAAGGPAFVEATAQQTAGQPAWSPPRVPALGDYSAFPTSTAPASPSLQGCGAPKASDGGGGEDRDQCPLNRPSAEELPRAILDTGNTREALQDLEEPALPEAGETSSQDVHASPGPSAQRAALAAEPDGKGHVLQPAGDSVPASKQEAAVLGSSPALRAAGHIEYVACPPLGNAPGVANEHDNTSSQITPVPEKAISVIPPGFLEAPGQSGYVTASADDSAAAPHKDVDAVLPADRAEANTSVDLPGAPAAAAASLNGTVSTPGVRQADPYYRQAGPNDKEAGPKGAKNGYVTLPEDIIAKNGYIALPEGTAAKNGYVTLPEGIPARNSCVALPEDIPAKNGCVALPEGTAAKNGYVTLPEGIPARNGCVALPEDIPAKNGCVALPEDNAANAACQERNDSLTHQTPQGFSPNGYVSPV